MNRSTQARRAVLLAGLICLAALTSAAWRGAQGTSAASGWNIQTVGAPAQKWFQAVGARYLQLDAAGNPRLAYGGDHLYYAWRDGAAWHTEIVDSTDHVGAGASLALDRAGRPHISYCDQAAATVKYAHWTGTAWEIQVATTGDRCARTALALDVTDAPQISYATDAGVRYARWTEQGWTVRTIASGRYADLALDRAGQPHVAYLVNNDSLRHIWFDGQDWHDESVITLGEGETSGTSYYLASLSLALDGQDTPHVSYTFVGYPNYMPWTALGYARRTAGAWVFAEIIYNAKGAVALALDAAGDPHISYGDGVGLKYRRWTGSAWEEQAVERTAPRAGDTAIALDGNAAPHIGYISPTYGSAIAGQLTEPALRYATLAAGVWVRELVDRSQDTGIHAALALDAAGQPHISQRDRGGALRYAAWPGDAWASETIDAAAGATPGPTALALDRAGRSHIGYVVADTTLKYAHQTATGWQITIVANAVARPASSGDEIQIALALDRGDAPHFCYFGADGMLKYVRWTGSAWETRDVDAVATGGAASVSLALDAADAPHIAYAGWDGPLRYARWIGSAWWTFDVDAHAGAGVTLALDAAARPHIGYVTSGAPATLKYAAWTAGGWQIAVVDGGDATFPALALDAAGAPHLGYYDAAAHLLQYAQRTGAAWDISTVTPVETLYTTDRNLFNSLALDQMGRPHMSYHDPTAHAARYAALASTPQRKWLPLMLHP